MIMKSMPSPAVIDTVFNMGLDTGEDGSDYLDSGAENDALDLRGMDSVISAARMALYTSKFPKPLALVQVLRK